MFVGGQHQLACAAVRPRAEQETAPASTLPLSFRCRGNGRPVVPAASTTRLARTWCASLMDLDERGDLAEGMVRRSWMVEWLWSWQLLGRQ